MPQKFGFTVLGIIAIVGIVAIFFGIISFGKSLNSNMDLVGAAVSPTIKCIDSDKLDYHNAGNVTISRNISGRVTFNVYHDRCSGNKILREQYCSSTSKAGTKSYRCPQECRNGACVQPQPNVICKDWDNGRNYSVRAQIWGICIDCPGQPAGGNNDFCVDNKKLAEFYCVDSFGWKREDVNCEYGCFEGMCKEETRQPLRTCLDTNLGEKSCIDSQTAAVCTYENKLTFWKHFPCRQGCSNGYCNEEKMYDCTGQVNNGLCYNNGYTPHYDGWKDSYEDENFKIEFQLPSGTRVNEQIQIRTIVTNKKDQPLDLPYQYFIDTSTGRKISSNLLTNDNAPKRGIQLSLAPSETKNYLSVFEIFGPTVKGIPRLIFGFTLWPPEKDAVGLNIALREIEPIENFLLCNKGVKYPKRLNLGGSESSYESAKCCNNVFYPSFLCCADSDCGKGKCVDGWCIDKNNNNGNDLAIGNKRVLFIVFSKDSPSSNPCLKLSSHRLVEGVEQYFDNMAQKYLNENSDFINFEWNVYGAFDLRTLNLREDEIINDYRSIINSVISQCRLDTSDRYDEIILVSREYSPYWCGSHSDCASGHAIILSGKRSTTTAHELAHKFGCSDIYSTMGGDYQWYGELMSAGREDISNNNLTLDSLPGLQICRGEMGWTDLNGNGVIEVKDWQKLS